MLSTPRHIFIVEDNEIYSMMLDYFLSKDGNFRFYSFNSGEECIRNLYLNPHIIILDYSLPGINGYETLIGIKKINPEVHIVVLTTNDDCELAAKFFRAGADDYILKEGAGEAQIVEKIETILAQEEIQKRKSFKEKLFYFILFITLLTLGIVWYEV